MRKILIAAAITFGGAAPALAEPTVTTSVAIMHRAPRPESRVLQEIPPNAQIDLINCTGEWCYASWRKIYGYIPAFTVQGAPAPAAVAPAPVIVERPVVVAPAWGWGGPYVGVGWGWGWHGW
ncbi:MAG: hypothetical protein JO288_06040 [Hyphomicrobiales bacterium]|nr:hypothetical protein [Hyphomicrobiales bacterium]